MLRAAVVAAAALGLVYSAAPTPEQNAATWVATYQSAISRNDLGSLAIRDMTAAAWTSAWLPAGFNATLITEYLDTVFAHQLPDGNWPWQFNEDTNVDPNSVEFISLPLLRVFVEQGDQLPASWAAAQLPKLQLAASAVVRHVVPTYYTNIYTMRIVNLFLYGQYLNSANYTAVAEAALANFTQLQRSQTSHEYDSPTYSAVAANNLISGIASIQNASVVASISSLYYYLLADLAAHSFSAGAGLTGAHSRDYDFVCGNGGIDYLFAFTGLQPNVTLGFADPITQVQLWVNNVRGSIPPTPTSTAQLASTAGRTVLQTYSPYPGEENPAQGYDKYTFVGSSFALGSTSSYYGPQDKQIVGTLPAPQPGPNAPIRRAQLTMVLDPFDSPYGEVKTADSSGHLKPTHLRNHISAVQDRGLLLSLADLTPQFGGNTTYYTTIGANLVFPYDVDRIYLNGQVVQPSSWGYNISDGNNTVVAVAAGGGILAFRLFGVDGLLGYTPTTRLLFDSINTSYAGRLVTYMYQGPNTTIPTPPPTSRVGVLVAGGDVPQGKADEAAFLKLFNSIQLDPYQHPDGHWRVTSQGAPGSSGCGSSRWPWLCTTLCSILDIPNGAVSERTINGTNYTPQQFRYDYGNGTAVDIRLS